MADDDDDDDDDDDEDDRHEPVKGLALPFAGAKRHAAGANVSPTDDTFDAPEQPMDSPAQFQDPTPPPDQTE